MSLKPQDILIVLKLVALGDREWSYQYLADELYMSASGVHAGIRRAADCKLLDSYKNPIREALQEFLTHGIRYVWPPKHGGLVHGMPTAYAAPPLNTNIVQPSEYPPVWATLDGPTRGMAFSPLFRSAPAAAAKDAKLYEMLALVDAVRGGRAREIEMARHELRKRLWPDTHPMRVAESIRSVIGAT
jgi:hypothetical protein